MRNFGLQAATFLVMTAAAFSQKPAGSVPTSEAVQKDEQQVRQLETEMLKGEMESDPAAFEKILAEDCLHLPAGPDLTKAKLLQGIRDANGQAPPYTARLEDMNVYILGDTAIAMYMKEYAPRAHPGQIDDQDVTDVFVRRSGAWNLKISRSSPHQKR